MDATNLANLELGQPTHAFDADTVRGVVRVREATGVRGVVLADGALGVPRGAKVEG
ncbi:MAG: phenylalanine--tRNA ligase beta subunit-related protein, partial [bacterium]